MAGALLLLTLGGCSDEPETAPANVPVPVTSDAVTAPPSSGVVAGPAAGESGPGGFVTEVQRELPDLALDRRDDELAALGQQSCAGLQAGRPAEDVVAEVRAFGADRISAGALVRLAIRTVCPQQTRRAGEF